MSVRGFHPRTSGIGGLVRSAAVRLCWMLSLLLAYAPLLPGIPAELLAEEVEVVAEEGKFEEIQPRDRGRSRIDVRPPERRRTTVPRHRDDLTRRDQAYLPLGNPSGGFVLPLRL